MGTVVGFGDQPRKPAKNATGYPKVLACAAVILLLHVYLELRRRPPTSIGRERTLTKAEEHYDCAYQAWQLSSNEFGAKAKMHYFSPYTHRRNILGFRTGSGYDKFTGNDDDDTCFGAYPLHLNGVPLSCIARDWRRT